MDYTTFVFGMLIGLIFVALTLLLFRDILIRHFLKGAVMQAIPMNASGKPIKIPLDNADLPDMENDLEEMKHQISVYSTLLVSLNTTVEELLNDVTFDEKTKTSLDKLHDKVIEELDSLYEEGYVQRIEVPKNDDSIK